VGVQVADYRQLRGAVTFLEEHGSVIRWLPAELTPGVGPNVFAIEPSGQAAQIYHSMWQIG
jgi:hypothetical protein